MAAVWTLTHSFDLPEYVGFDWVTVKGWERVCVKVSDPLDAIKQISEQKPVQVWTQKTIDTSVKWPQEASRKSLNSRSCTALRMGIENNCRHAPDSCMTGRWHKLGVVQQPQSPVLTCIQYIQCSRAWHDLSIFVGNNFGQVVRKGYCGMSVMWVCHSNTRWLHITPVNSTSVLVKLTTYYKLKGKQNAKGSQAAKQAVTF